MFEIGMHVRVKQNAYEGSSDPTDLAVRGKVGKIVWIIDEGCFEVWAGDDFHQLTDDEIEEISETEKLTINTVNDGTK